MMSDVKLKVGNVVRLKSGSVDMTITSLVNNHATVTWQEEHEINYSNGSSKIDYSCGLFQQDGIHVNALELVR